MRRLPRSFAVLFLPLLLCGCGPKTEEEPIWIGCVAAFSGGDPSPGAAVKQGVALAVDDSAGLRVEGRRLSVIAADDRGSDETAQAETVRLLAVNHVAALIGGADPGRALRLARAAQPYGAPVVLPGDAAGPLPGDAVFTLCVRPAWRGQVLARYASGVLKAKRAFVLTDPRNPVAVELAAGFVQAWPTGEGETLEQATFQADADLPAGRPARSAAKPDVVLIAATVSDFSQAAAQLATDGCTRRCSTAARTSASNRWRWSMKASRSPRSSPRRSLQSAERDLRKSTRTAFTRRRICLRVRRMTPHACCSTPWCEPRDRPPTVCGIRSRRPTSIA